MAQLNAEDLITRVQQRADISRSEADEALNAVFATLGERISGGEFRDIVAELPGNLVSAADIESNREAQAFDRDAFIDRVARRENASLDHAKLSTQAVLSVLRDTISRQETSNARSELPSGLKTIFEELHFR